MVIVCANAVANLSELRISYQLLPRERPLFFFGDLLNAPFVEQPSLTRFGDLLNAPFVYQHIVSAMSAGGRPSRTVSLSGKYIPRGCDVSCSREVLRCVQACTTLKAKL